MSLLQVLFVLINADVKENMELAQYFNLKKEDLPAIRYVYVHLFPNFNEK